MGGKALRRTELGEVGGVMNTKDASSKGLAPRGSAEAEASTVALGLGGLRCLHTEKGYFSGKIFSLLSATGVCVCKRSSITVLSDMSPVDFRGSILVYRGAKERRIRGGHGLAGPLTPSNDVAWL